MASFAIIIAINHPLFRLQDHRWLELHSRRGPAINLQWLQVRTAEWFSQNDGLSAELLWVPSGFTSQRQRER